MSMTYSHRWISAKYDGFSTGGSCAGALDARSSQRRDGISRLSVIDVTLTALGLAVALFTAWLGMQQYSLEKQRNTQVGPVAIDTRGVEPEQAVAARVGHDAERTRRPAPRATKPVGDVYDIIDDQGEALANVESLVDIAAGGSAMEPLKFKKHVDDPSPNELRKSVGPGVIATGLLAFPSLREATSDANPFKAQF